MNNDNRFEYTYSAPTEYERRQIEQIRAKYAPKSEDECSMQTLKALDNKIHSTATMLALVFGILGCLIFGLGLTMVLEWNILTWGIVIMAIGCIPMAFAYPAYTASIKRGKQKYGEKILQISNQLLNKE